MLRIPAGFKAARSAPVTVRGPRFPLSVTSSASARLPQKGKSFLRQRLETRPTGIQDKADATRNVQCIRTPAWDSLKTRLLHLISPLFVSIALFFLWLLSFSVFPTS